LFWLLFLAESETLLSIEISRLALSLKIIQAYLAAILLAFSLNFFFSLGSTYGIGSPLCFASVSSDVCLFSSLNNSLKSGIQSYPTIFQNGVNQIEEFFSINKVFKSLRVDMNIWVFFSFLGEFSMSSVF
jgi:hypothetical protein